MITMSADMIRVIHKTLDENYELSAFKFGDIDGSLLTVAWSMVAFLAKELSIRLRKDYAKSHVAIGNFVGI
jgi:hypothetical protein